MTTHRNRCFGALALLGLALAAPQHGAAQQRMVIPPGTVLTVRTENPLSSTSARVGQTFQTTLTEPLNVEGYVAFPQGSTVQGQITSAQPASSRSSGTVGVAFDRVTLPNGRSVGIVGKLTSADPAERRQIEETGGNVVFVGGRRGLGAAIAGVGTNDSNDPVSGVLGALGSIFSSGTDVSVPAGTVLAVQLENALTLSVSGRALGSSDPYNLSTSTQVIRAAQQALRDKNYYRGQVNGQLNDATQQALFQFQIDNRLRATGNLDGRTVQALGLSTSTGGVGGALTAADAALVRRNAQTLVAQWRTSIGIAANGRLDANRDYRATDLDAYFALSGFADNASLYEQMVRASGNVDVGAASEALAASARRVDDALRLASAPSGLMNTWRQVRASLTRFESSDFR